MRLSESTRVEVFSDAVLAIVLTLLVLDFQTPSHEAGRLSGALTQTWASVVAILISYLRVSVLWLNHHDIFARIRRVDRRLLSLNLWLLLNCAIIPIPTAVLADALRGGAAADLRAAAALYILLATILVASWLPIFRHLRDHPELIELGTDTAFLHARRIRVWIGAIVDAVAIAVAMFAPIAALALWTLTLVVLAATSDVVPGFRSRRDDSRTRPRNNEHLGRPPRRVASGQRARPRGTMPRGSTQWGPLPAKSIPKSDG